MDGSTATSKKPTIISAQVCSPHVTAESGSGLCGLFFELSKVAMACNVVPRFQLYRLRQAIAELPIEIVVGNAQ